MKPILKKSIVIIVLAAGMVVAIAITPQAGSALQQTAGPYAWRALAYQWLANQVNLTDAQKAQAKTIYQAAWQNTKPLMEQLQQKRQAMTDAVKANDATQIRQLAAIQGTLMGQLAAARAEARAQFYQMLTPEQRAKLATIEQNMRTRLEQRAQWRQQWWKKSNQ